MSKFEKYLPKRYENDLATISQALEWIGVNYYTRSIVKFDENDPIMNFALVSGDLPKTDMGWEISQMVFQKF